MSTRTTDITCTKHGINHTYHGPSTNHLREQANSLRRAIDVPIVEKAKSMLWVEAGRMEPLPGGVESLYCHIPDRNSKNSLPFRTDACTYNHALKPSGCTHGRTDMAGEGQGSGIDAFGVDTAAV